MKYTPEHIVKLEQNEIFVFGSNLNGAHGGGAARAALQWGAKWGVSEGLEGQTYALPTLDKNMQKVTNAWLHTYIVALFDCIVKQINRDKVFYLTKIGCGIAGWEIETVAKIFYIALRQFNYDASHSLICPKYTVELGKNLIIPKEFDVRFQDVDDIFEDIENVRKKRDWANEDSCMFAENVMRDSYSKLQILIDEA